MTVTPRPSTFDRVVVVHGFQASPGDHWFPWLSMVDDGIEVLHLPTPDRPVAAEWIELVAQALGRLDPAVAVVAHSLGCITAARAIATLPLLDDRLGAFIAVAPFAEALPAHDDPDLAALVEEGLPSFLDGYDPHAIRARVRAARVIRSDDDPTVPPAASENFARDLEADVVVVPGAGHFCAADGITRLDAVTTALATLP